MVEQARELVAMGLERDPPLPGRPRLDRHLRAARASPRRRSGASPGARGGGHGVVLGIDYHHRLSVAEAASFCQKMPPGTLDFLEEPIRDETPEAYERCAG
jgi:galactonate dehydratase